jgi:hypothetical protein
VPSPLHVSAFDKFASQITNHIEASIAFGLFLESERAWADEWTRTSGATPTEKNYHSFHAACLTNHSIQGYAEGASRILNKYANETIEKTRPAFLTAALESYNSAASIGHSAWRWQGVFEAVLGAFVWTVVLIAINIILVLGGIDLFEMNQKLMRAFHQNQTQSQSPQPHP